MPDDPKTEYEVNHEGLGYPCSELKPPLARSEI
jgi:hypothetical protein